MKAVVGPLPPDDTGWGYELKWDGVRVIAAVAGGQVRLTSSNGNDVTGSYPELAGLATAVGGLPVVLDGEVVALDPRGRPDFGLLQQRMHVHDPAEVGRRAARVPIAYQVFDLLSLDGHDTTGLPFAERRRLLAELLAPGPSWALSAIHDDGHALYEAAVALGLEGVMAKRLDSAYEAGRRAASWRKIKIRRQQELVVGGWAEGSGRRAGHFGALLVGYYDDDALRYAGRVGTGFDDRELARLRPLLVGLETAIDGSPAPDPFVPTPPAAHRRGAHWVRPELVVEVAFGEWTQDGRLRHPSYLGQRTDKDPHEVVREPDTSA